MAKFLSIPALRQYLQVHSARRTKGPHSAQQTSIHTCSCSSDATCFTKEEILAANNTHHPESCEKTALHNRSISNARKPCVDSCHKEMIRVGMPMVDGLYFEQQEFGSHNCQVHAINNVCGECLLTTKTLHKFIRNKALGDSELAPGWKATYNKNQGFSDDAVDAWLSTQNNLSLQEIYKVPNQCLNLDKIPEGAD